MDPSSEDVLERPEHGGWAGNQSFKGIQAKAGERANKGEGGEGILGWVRVKL